MAFKETSSMRMARPILTSLLVFVALMAPRAVAAQTPEPYADAKLTLEKFSDTLGTFGTDMEKADSNEAMTACLNRLTESMKTLVPAIKAMNKKYPELAQESTHPEPLRPLLKKVDKGLQGLLKGYQRIAAQLSDPVLKEADKKYREVMAGLK
jgi:hypothetical protein